MGRRQRQQRGYTPPAGGPVHAFRRAEKAYKKYNGVHTDFTSVVDLAAPNDHVFALQGKAFRQRPIDWSFNTGGPCDTLNSYGLRNHDGFYVVPGALSLDEQLLWIKHCVCDYLHGRTNITHAPAKGAVLAPVDPTSAEGLARLRWATLGAQFDWTSRTYVAPGEGQRVDFPADLLALAEEVYAAFGAPFSVDHGVNATVNYYSADRQMCGHIDDSEGDLTVPLVSMSLGLSCVFLLGQDTYDTEPTALFLRSGDLVVMSGPSRRSVHGVPRILEGTFPPMLRDHIMALLSDEVPPLVKEYACDTRFNVNVRTGVFRSAAAAP